MDKKNSGPDSYSEVNEAAQKYKYDSEKRCNGAPDMVIEILSPSRSKYDLIIKQGIYQEAGVCEYWIVDPEDKLVKVYVQNNGYCLVRIYRSDETIAATVLEGCTIELPDVFSDIS